MLASSMNLRQRWEAWMRIDAVATQPVLGSRIINKKRFIASWRSHDAIGQKAEMANSHETLGKNMVEESADELRRR